MKAGYQVIRELGKYGLKGYYFTYEQYRILTSIKNFSDVKDKIAEWGYIDVKNANDVSELVTILKNSKGISGIDPAAEKGCLTALIAEPLFWLLLLFSGC